jgi:O-antigen ligase
MPAKELLLKIRKVFFWSLIVASVYGFFETLFTVFHITPALTVVNLLGYFPFLEPSYHESRISSIAYEPPFLAIYLITIAGWMFSYVLTEKGIFKFIPLLLILILTYFSGSRTALLVIFIQLSIFVFYLYKLKEYRVYILYSAIAIMFSAVTLLAINAEKVIRSVETKLESLNFKDNLTKNVSNKSRFGMQYAALKVFQEHPIVGVGFGQQTYHSRFHYPGWATKKNYEFELWYKNPNEKPFPPAYNMYTRMLAELGIVGTGIFVWLLYSVIKRSRRLARIHVGEEKILAIILLITFVGFAINWLQLDTFRIYGFWLCLAILIRLNSYKVSEAHE